MPSSYSISVLVHICIHVYFSRPFLSGQVAYSLASEVIGLLHGLVTTPRAAEVWSTAIKQVTTYPHVVQFFISQLELYQQPKQRYVVTSIDETPLCLLFSPPSPPSPPPPPSLLPSLPLLPLSQALLKSLHSIPQLAPRLVSFTELAHKHIATGTPPPSPGELLQASCIANATFAALGGFKESVRLGMEVKVIGEGLVESRGVVQSIAERRGIASVQFSDDEFCFGPNKTLDVPLSRLLPPQKEMLPLKQLEVGPELCSAICAILETTTPSISHAHSSSDANNPSLGLCRLFAEMRTRACMALSSHVQQSSDFLKLFLATGCWENLQRQFTSNPGERNRVSQRSEVFISSLLLIGLRLTVVESHCLSLRMLYRDCARPAAPKIEKPRSEVTDRYIHV